MVRADDGRRRSSNLFDGPPCWPIGPQYRAGRPPGAATGWSAFDSVGTGQHGLPSLSMQALKSREPSRARGLGVHRSHLAAGLAEPQPAGYIRAGRY